MLASTMPSPNGITAQAIKATVKVMIGAIRNRPRFALVGMGYSVWRGFNPRKSEKPGPHNGWRNQDGTRK